MFFRIARRSGGGPDLARLKPDQRADTGDTVILEIHPMNRVL
jgi:hypothetical protein